jgi:predicted small lipoprotein YifL
MRGASRAGLVAAGAALLLCGCGQKGPLYLPDKGGKVVTSTPAASQAPPAAPATATPGGTATPAAPATPKPGDKDKDQDQDQAPPPKP